MTLSPSGETLITLLATASFTPANSWEQLAHQSERR